MAQEETNRIKASSAAKSRVEQPGAVSVSDGEASRLDQRVSDKFSNVHLVSASSNEVAFAFDNLQAKNSTAENSKSLEDSTSWTKRDLLAKDSAGSKYDQLGAHQMKPAMLVSTPPFEVESSPSTSRVVYIDPLSQQAQQERSVRSIGVEIDLEVAHQSDDQVLAVATEVNEEGEPDHAQLPSAVEFDPDAKPLEWRRRRKRLYLGFVVSAVFLIGVGIIVGVVAMGQGKSDVPVPTSAPTSYRATLGIRESIESVVGADRLVNPQSPYLRALDWILNEDPLELTPANKTLYQRYFAAYLYFATSETRPWTSCGPPNGKETSSCSFQTTDTTLSVGHVGQYNTFYFPALRWMSDASECFWAGVTCDHVDQIRGINLAGMNVTGTFPEGIVSFSFLQSFSLNWGSIRGTIPAEIAAMKSLATLKLNANELSGQISTSLWSMPSLKVYDFGVNQLTGSFPTEATKNVDIKGLMLQKNRFSGTIPREIGLLKSAFIISFYDNLLHGSIPTEVGLCFGIRRLLLFKNQLTGTIPTEFGQLSFQTEYFDLSTNDFSGSIPEQIYKLDQVTTLFLSNNRLTGTLSTSIGQLTNLGYLDLSQNDLNGTIPSQMQQLTDMSNLLLNDNQFTGSVPLGLCALRGGRFDEFVADCLADPITELVRIACSASCCTQCCGSDGLCVAS